MNGLVGKGSSAIMTVSTSQSHTQKAMLRERRRRRKRRREYQKGSLVHVLRAHPQLHQSAPGLCVWATKWSVCGQETAATTSRSPVFTVLLLAFWWQKRGAGPFHHQGNGPQVGPKVGPGDSWLPSHHWVHNIEETPEVLAAVCIRNCYGIQQLFTGSAPTRSTCSCGIWW